MPSATTIRIQIETALASRIPAALTPQPRATRPVVSTGIDEVDAFLDGGLPVGAITEITGAESSGRSSLALSFVGRRTREGKVCAWIDVSDSLRPESASAAGVELSRMLWVRCRAGSHSPASQAKSTFRLPKECLVAPTAKKGLYTGGWGGHPRGEVKGLSTVMEGLLQAPALAPRCAEPQRRVPLDPQSVPAQTPFTNRTQRRNGQPQKPWSQLDKALRATDLLLQGGGFSTIVLDMGSIAAESASRVPLATWFRYRAGAESSQTSILLLTQYPCAKSSAGLVLRLHSTDGWHDESTVFTGLEFDIEIGRERFAPPSNLVSLRKEPQRETGTHWSNRCGWAGRR
jgi:hypothetical protein